MTPPPKNRWQEPQDGWIPLGLAIFRFGIAEIDCSTTEAPPTDLFSIEAFEQSRGSDVGFEVAYEPKGPTLEELTEHLLKHAGASKVEIDREAGRFLFSFPLSGGGVSRHGGAPWELLSDPRESLELTHRLVELLKSGPASNYEAPYEGFAKIEAGESAEGAQRIGGVRFASGLVWRQFMLRAFDRAVKAGRVKLFSRSPSTSNDFQELPSDVWPLLDVVDWEHGVARDIQERLYNSIHVADAAVLTLVERLPLSSDDGPPLRQKIRQSKKELWPSGDLPARAKDRDAAIIKWFRDREEIPPSEKTISRALAAD